MLKSSASLIILPLVALLMWSFGFFRQVNIIAADHVMPLYELAGSWLGNHHLLIVFTALFLVVVEAFLLNYIVKKIREQRGLMQKEVAAAAKLQASNYSKMESGQREVSIEALDKIAKLFGMTVDEVIHFEGKLPKEVKIEDKTANEKLHLLAQLEEEDKQAVYRVIDSMLTKSKFKEFFNKNMAAL